jgi:diguanylate cyclase (GGDEF)-like protein
MDYIYMLLIIILSIVIIIKQFQNRSLNRKLNTVDILKKEMYDLGEKVSNSKSKDEVYSVILDSAIKLVGRSGKGSILILEEDGYFHFKALRGFSDNLREVVLSREEIYLYKINNYRDTAIVRNPRSFDEAVIDREKTEKLKKYEALDIMSTIISPIYVDDILIGAINVDNVDSSNDFNEEDIKVMNYITHELSLALRNFFTQDRLRYMANFDELTGIYNRRKFKKLLVNELETLDKNKADKHLILMDLDDFKSINDSFGHNEGDRALIFLAEILRENIGHDGIYARMSGDEFVVFLKGDIAAVRSKMDGIREKFEAKKIGSVNLRFSYGICSVYPDNKLTMDEIFGIADRNMYKDKKNKYCKR